MPDVKVEWDFITDEFPEGDPYGKESTPTIVSVPDYVVEETELPYGEDYVSDWLSDEYGWCVFDWEIVEENN
jgi:hypothetical protein